MPMKTNRNPKTARPRATTPIAARVTIPAMLAALTAIGAVIAIPLPGGAVPFTLQVFFVLLAGAVAGPTDGATSMLVYLALGTAGIPVFSMMTAGPGVLLGPRGGYLMAFPVAALVTGVLAGPRSGAGVLRTVLAMLLGLASIYALGAIWLCRVTGKSPGAALAVGVVPFIPLDVAKALAAAVIASKRKGWRGSGSSR